MKQKPILTYSLLVLSSCLYMALGYTTERTDFSQLLLLFALCFAAYVYLLNQRFPVWLGIGAAIVFRLLLLFAIPALSDDYFRFIWDGRLLVAGINPYLHLPSYFMAANTPEVAGISKELFQQLNSPEYYSVYPPVAQFIFWLGTVVSPASVIGSMVIMRAVLIIAEIGSIFLLQKLLRKTGVSNKHVLIYALNPLVILEITGNLHFEGLMIFFILLSLYLLVYHKVFLAGCAMGLAVGVKLLPLLFMPFIWRKSGTRQFLIYAAATLITLIIIAFPLITPDVIANIFQSINLYFQRFEFNASIYYILRWIGTTIIGYNPIAVIGPLLSLVTFLVIVALALSKKIGSVKRTMGFMAAALTLYLFMATTVHPWYITTLVALTAVSHFRFAILWSGLAIVSYAAYRTPAYSEDTALITIEYTLIFIWLLTELYLYRQRYKTANLK